MTRSRHSILLFNLPDFRFESLCHFHIHCDLQCSIFSSSQQSIPTIIACGFWRQVDHLFLGVSIGTLGISVTGLIGHSSYLITEPPNIDLYSFHPNLPRKITYIADKMSAVSANGSPGVRGRQSDQFSIHHDQGKYVSLHTRQAAAVSCHSITLCCSITLDHFITLRRTLTCFIRVLSIVSPRAKIRLL